MSSKSVLAVMVGIVLLCAPRGARAGEELFPTYPAIEKNVHFWEKVFAEYSLSQGVLHDRDDLGIIYAVVEVLPPSSPCASETNRLRLDPVKEGYRQILLRLAMGEGPASVEEQRVLDLFGPAPASERLLAAADNIRVQIGQKERFREGLVRSGAWLAEIRQAFEAEGVPADLAYLAHVESSFNPRAESKVGAVGLWQFMRATGRRFLNIDSARDERLNPIKASRAAARFLRENYKVLGSWPVAITAYNHGQGGMHKATQEYGDLPGILAGYQGKSFGFASRNFYAEFLAARNVASDYQKYFGALEIRSPEASRQMVVSGRVDFCRLADYMKLDPATLRECNPDLRKKVKSGSMPIPAGHVLSLPQRLVADSKYSDPLPDNLYSAEEIKGDLYRVKSGDTLSSIARKFATSAALLTEMNDLEKPSALKVGQFLRVPVGKEAAVAGDNRLAQAEDYHAPSLTR
jgi:membrane-bound lytic murein transglycosylase D